MLYYMFVVVGSVLVALTSPCAILHVCSCRKRVGGPYEPLCYITCL